METKKGINLIKIRWIDNDRGVRKRQSSMRLNQWRVMKMSAWNKMYFGATLNLYFTNYFGFEDRTNI